MPDRVLPKPLVWKGKSYEVIQVEPGSPYFDMRASMSNKGNKWDVPPAFVLKGSRCLYGLIPWPIPNEKIAFHVVNLKEDRQWKAARFGRAGFEYDAEKDELHYCARFFSVPARRRYYQEMPTPILLPNHF